jgi:hypothetical protein
MRYCVGSPKDHLRQAATLRKALIAKSSQSHIWVYRVSHELRSLLRESVPYVKLYRYNSKHICPKLNGYGDNGQRKFENLTAVTHLLINKCILKLAGHSWCYLVTSELPWADCSAQWCLIAGHGQWTSMDSQNYRLLSLIGSCNGKWL